MLEKQTTPRIIHSFPVWLPQTQTWMYNQVDQLQKLGVDAHVVCERTENLDQFRVDKIHSLENEPRYRQLWDKGLRKLRIRRHLAYLVKCSKATNAQIIHSHFGDVAWADLDAVRKLNIKHVVTFYGFDVIRLPTEQPIWRQRYLRLFAKVDRVLCEGSHMARCIMKWGCPERKIKVQHLGVDVDNIPFQPRQWQNNEPLRVLIAASFREKKGIPYAIQALEIVARKIPVQLTIIGDAGQKNTEKLEKKRISSTLEKSGLGRYTQLLGYQTHSTMLKEAYQQHLFLQPSVTAKSGDTEGGAPVSIIEMLASGMPVVATNHCDIPEVVGAAYANYLAPERDAEKLAEGITTLLDRADEWPILTQQGRQHVENQYHRLVQSKRLLKHYSDILHHL